MTISFAFIGRICPRGQVFSDCVSSCPPSCASPSPQPKLVLGQCREECVGGCECPPGLHLHQGNCLKRHDCPCFYRRRTYQPGDRIQQRCNIWYCCLACKCLAFTCPHSFQPFSLFQHPLVCAEADNGSALGRNVQSSAG